MSPKRRKFDICDSCGKEAFVTMFPPKRGRRGSKMKLCIGCIFKTGRSEEYKEILKEEEREWGQDKG